jgi:hypothetical protein
LVRARLMFRIADESELVWCIVICSCWRPVGSLESPRPAAGSGSWDLRRAEPSPARRDRG